MTKPVQGPQFSPDGRDVVDGVDEDGNLSFRQVDIRDVSFVGRFGALAHSNTSNDISIGAKRFTLDRDENKFRIGDDVQIQSLDDFDCSMWGIVVDKDTTITPCEITVYVDDISDPVITGTNWELQVVARPKPGIERDTSTTEIAFAAVGSTMTFTVTADKFFPIGGKLLVTALELRTAAAIGLVKAYSGTSLVLEVVGKTATATGTFDSWAIALLDAPQNPQNYYAVDGMRVYTDPNGDDINDFGIMPGRVRDYDDTIDIVLGDFINKKLDAVWAAGTAQGGATQSANLPGTISSSGTSVTGTTTSFTESFESGAGAALNIDFNTQITEIDLFGPFNSIDPFHPAIITAGSVTTAVTNVASDTSLTTAAALGVTGATYKRGGPAMGSAALTYAVGVCVKDSDGTVDAFASSLTGEDGEGPSANLPDLPTGYTKFRTLALVTWDGLNPLVIKQPLKVHQAPVASEIGFDNWGTGGTGITAVDVQGAIEELADEKYDASNIVIGTYTPTLTAGANVAATTSGVCLYTRIGSRVFVNGAVNVDPTAGAGAATVLDISLPVSSNLAAATDLLGNACALGHNEAIGIVGEATNNRAQATWLSQTTANHTIVFNFQYTII